MTDAQLDLFGAPTPAVQPPPTVYVARVDKSKHYGTTGRIIALDGDPLHICEWRAWALDPGPGHRAKLRAGDLTDTEYRDQYLGSAWSGVEWSWYTTLRPGVLEADHHSRDSHHLVQSGDTLVCTCDGPVCRDVCLRASAAFALVRAGWSVVLDGRPIC